MTATQTSRTTGNKSKPGSGSVKAIDDNYEAVSQAREGIGACYTSQPNNSMTACSLNFFLISRKRTQWSHDWNITNRIKQNHWSECLRVELDQWDYTVTKQHSGATSERGGLSTYIRQQTVLRTTVVHLKLCSPNDTRVEQGIKRTTNDQQLQQNSDSPMTSPYGSRFDGLGLGPGQPNSHWEYEIFT